VSLWLDEAKLFVRSPASVAALVMLALIACVAIIAGTREIDRQRAAIDRLLELQSAEDAVLRARASSDGDAGSAAYYGFHPTWDPPSTLAFAALGFRDVAPGVLRVRALGLEAQRYENETFNPELALPGRFDFAFVLIYLVPLFVIALVHDLISSEREAGRLPLLRSLTRRSRPLWLRRAVLRGGAVLAAIAIPLGLGSLWNGVSGWQWLATLAIVAAYIAIWIAITCWLTRSAWTSAANAALMAVTWATLTLLLPAIAQTAIARAIPLPQGIELTLAQREIVHAAWDLPKEQTLDQFFRYYPEWRDTAPVRTRFHWKWYYAFHELGDRSVARDVAAYRDGLLQRQRWSERLGVVLPSVGAQALMHRLARTDLHAQLAYQDAIGQFHTDLREFYYPFLFEARSFGTADFDRIPRFTPRLAHE
jgi:ABC-2 type transport system permease protein